MTDLKAQLDAIDPRLWLVFWAFAVGAVIYGLKQAGLWAKLPRRVKVPMSAILGALMTTVADVTIDPERINLAKLVLDAAIGAFSGLTATGGHQFWTRIGASQPTTKESEASS